MIHIRCIFEVMGWPKEKLNEALQNLIKNFRKSGWEVWNETYGEPELIGKEKLYSSFVEFEAKIPSMRELIVFVLTYAPSYVEVLGPSELVIKANELQDILADVSARVNELDKQVKLFQAQTKILAQKLKKHETTEK